MQPQSLKYKQPLWLKISSLTGLNISSHKGFKVKSHEGLKMGSHQGLKMGSHQGLKIGSQKGLKIRQLAAVWLVFHWHTFSSFGVVSTRIASTITALRTFVQDQALLHIWKAAIPECCVFPFRKHCIYIYMYIVC